MIYMVGGAGYLNFGDELMVKGWLDFFRQYGGDRKIVLDGAYKTRLTTAFSERYPEISISEMINRLSRAGNAQGFWPSMIRGLTFFDRGGFKNYPDFKEDAEKMLNAEVIHLYGGGYLNDHFPKNSFLLGVAVAVSRMTGARLIGTGLGLLPIKPPTEEERAKIEGTFEQFEIFETRDQEGAEMVRGLAPTARILAGLDDTFLAPIAYQGNASPEGKRLHISWNDGQMNLPEFGRVERYVLDHHTAYDEVIFWACAQNDEKVWERLQPQVPGIRRLSFNDMLMNPLPLGPGDHILSARFHPHLIAARGGAVGGYFSPGEYYDIKHGSVCNLGSGFFPIRDKEIMPEHFGQRRNVLMDRTPALRAGKLGRAIMTYCENVPAA